MSATGTNSAQSVAVEIIDVIPRLNRWAESNITNGTSDYNVSLRQLSALGIIEDESTTLGDVARHLGVTPAVVTGLIDRLESRGYVQRINSTDDRRRIVLKMTPEGRDAASKAEEALAAKLENTLGSMSSADLDSIASGLQHLQDITGSLEQK